MDYLQKSEDYALKKVVKYQPRNQVKSQRSSFTGIHSKMEPRECHNYSCLHFLMWDVEVPQISELKRFT